MANEPLSDSTFDRERDLFERALDLPETEREQFVQRNCGPDLLLSQRISALLLAHQGDKFLPRISSQAPEVREGSPAAIGGLIDRYKLIRVLGEGGCGIVYLAQQEQPVRRQVALKIIKAGMDTRSVIARFEAERQALALMDHPNIAKVFDAGATESGRSYFVMELVEGKKITDYCNQNHLSIKDRLDLFLQVCDAVQHAHQKSIIHRDLKPSNILIQTSSDLDSRSESPVRGNKLEAGLGTQTLSNCSSPHSTLCTRHSALPKVIDFGIAKAIEGKLTDATIHTGLHQFIGTPAYMSPEQADLSPDIDTRTDIYSLGVLLYELLTGKPPFDNHELLTAGLDEMRRIIREVEPQRPSQASRVCAPKKLSTLHSSLSTDLDWIILKCLEKDRSCRYATANALAADLKRFLLREPIAARPPSASYRFQKFFLRHRAASLAACFVTLALVLGASIVTWALLRERAAHRREQTALADANQRLEAALSFVDRIFNQVAPKFVDLTGAASAQQALGEAGLEFIKRLGHRSSELPAVRLALAKLLHQSSASQNPGNANTVGNFETGLKRAKEALDLLNAGPLPISDKERDDLLYWINVAIFHCLAGLERSDEVVAQAANLPPLLDRLERFPEQAREARRNRMSNRNFAGNCILRAGRPEESFTNYFLPIIRSDWASNILSLSEQIQPNAPDHYLQYELETIAGANDNASSALLLLKRFQQMLPFASEAVRIGKLLVKHFPDNAKWKVGHAEFLALSGVAMAWTTGRESEGVEALRQARAEIEQLVRLDAANHLFRWYRSAITTYQALAFAGMSEQNSTPPTERRQHLAQAESLLAEARQFPDVSELNGSPYFKLATNEIVIARAKIEESETALRETEHPPPPKSLDKTR